MADGKVHTGSHPLTEETVMDGLVVGVTRLAMESYDRGFADAILSVRAVLKAEELEGMVVTPKIVLQWLDGVEVLLKEKVRKGQGA